MPMKKDLPAMAEEQNQTGAELYHLSKQQTRKRDKVSLNEHQTLGTSFTTTAPRSLARSHNDTANHSVPRNHRHTLRALEIVENDDRSSYKMPLPPPNLTSEPQRSRDLVEPYAVRVVAQKQKSNTGSQARKQQQFPPISVFDDTTSLDSGFLHDGLEDDNPTIVPRNDNSMNTRTRGSVPQRYRQVQDSAQLIGGMSAEEYDDVVREGWEQELAEEEQPRAENNAMSFLNKQNGDKAQSPTTQERDSRPVSPMRAAMKVNPFAANKSRTLSMDEASIPDTPSRTQAVPPYQNKLEAPSAQHHVAFVSSPQFLGSHVDSPMVSSAQMTRDTSPSGLSRPASAFSAVRHTPLPQRPYRTLSAESRAAHNQVNVSHSAGRFHAMPQRSQPILQAQSKVSAHESDIQDSSEDERNKSEQQATTSDTVQTQRHTTEETNRKRRHDSSDTGALDYDSEVLLAKELSDLQNEPFNHDPRDDTQRQTASGHTANVDLAQRLSTLSELSCEAQRQLFRRQTDDDWAKTGQWFIAEFQRNLVELTNIRLNRRKVALQYENQIRQRQREVEHYYKGVSTELKELFDGGSGLLKDRKQPGSRSGTPSRPVRG